LAFIFISQELPPQQPSCLSDFTAVVVAVAAPSFFIEQESPQQLSCLSDFIAVVVAVAAPSFFIAQESPQQHACLSDFIAVVVAVLAPSFFIAQESPQQPSCFSDLWAWLVFAPSFILHASPLQQQDSIAQQESPFLFASLVFWASAKPLRARVIPSTSPGTNRRRFFISLLLLKKIIAGISNCADTFEYRLHKRAAI